MGNHRINLSIKAEFHGKTYEIKDAWWNWCGPVDLRVIEFFEEMYEDAMVRLDCDSSKDELRKIEANEKTELARLKAKYGEV